MFFLKISIIPDIVIFLSITNDLRIEVLNKLVEKAVENASTNDDLKLVSNIVENTKGSVADKIINSANKSAESKEKITEIIVKVVEKNPEKAIEIIKKNKNTNTVLETIKTKIENNQAVTADDFSEVFDSDLSPN